MKNAVLATTINTARLFCFIIIYIPLFYYNFCIFIHLKQLYVPEFPYMMVNICSVRVFFTLPAIQFSEEYC